MHLLSFGDKSICKNKKTRLPSYLYRPDTENDLNALYVVHEKKKKTVYATCSFATVAYAHLRRKKRKKKR